MYSWFKIVFLYTIACFIMINRSVKNKLPLIMQILGLTIFMIGTLSSKNSNLLPFLLACLTGLKME